MDLMDEYMIYTHNKLGSRVMLARTHLRSAIHSLRTTRFRSALTMLGVVIGVAAVIVVMGVGAGAKQRVVEQLRSLGANLVVVLPGSAKKGGVALGHGSERSLSDRDAEAIRREITTVVAAAPIVFAKTRIVSGNRNWLTNAYGVTADFFVAREWQIAAGRPFSPQELQAAAKVVLLGNTVAKELFGADDPVGQMVRIENIPFRVVGLLSEKGDSPTGNDQDDKAIVPLSTARIRILGAAAERLGSIRYILVKVGDATEMDQTRDQVRRLLRQRHRLLPDQPDDFEVRNLVDIQKSREQMAGVLGFWLTVVASVSLLVGGISIMNIMLVTVTERTREIGLRLALGARRRDIRHQFLAEAVVLSLIGALVGMVVGVVTALVVGAITGYPILILPSSILLAMSFAMATGIVFGLYPAWRAARLDPITALRREQ